MELGKVTGDVTRPKGRYGTFQDNQQGIDNPVYVESKDTASNLYPEISTMQKNAADLPEEQFQGNRLTLRNGFHGAVEEGEDSSRNTSEASPDPMNQVNSYAYKMEDDKEEGQDAKEADPTFEEAGKSQSTVAFQISESQSLLADKDAAPLMRTNSKSLGASMKGIIQSLKATDDKVKKRSWLTRMKIFVLFTGCFVSTAVFAMHPDMNLYGHQLSVAVWQSHELNVTGVNNHFCIVKLYMTGSFLLMPPGRYTQNITFSVTNPVTGYQQKTVRVIANQSDIITIPESIYDQRFDFCNETIHDEKPLVLKVESSTVYSAPVTVGFISNSQEVYNEVIYAAIILITVYVLIIFELIHRTLAAMIGALAALAVLADLNMKPTLNEVLEWLDYDTLALLFGMMLIVAIFCESGFFDWVALTSYKVTKGRLWPLITVLCLFSAFVSAFLDNVTTILLLTPVTIRLCEVLQIDPKHILIALVMFSNVGGTATAIGDPPNVIIVSNRELIEASNGNVNFATFTAHMFVGSLFTTAVTYGFIRFLYRNKELLKSEDPPEIAELKVEIDVWTRAGNKIAVTCREEEIMKELLQQKVDALQVLMAEKLEHFKSNPGQDFTIQLSVLEEKYRIRDWELLIKSSIVIVVVILCFFISTFAPNLNLTIGWIAVLGAIWLLVMTDYADMESVLDRIEWATLLFFAALFVLMEALTLLGLIDYIADLCISLISLIDEEDRLLAAITIILWISALASSFIDNIPFTTAMVPVVIQLANDSSLNLPLGPLVYSLAFGACLGGNGTLIGASANVVCAGVAENHGHKFSFWEFFKVGFPTMLVSVVVANIYLIICHVVFGWNI